MSIIAWLLLGLLAGFIGNKIVNRRGGGMLTNLVVGIVGAMAGGYLFQQFGSTGVTGVNFWSLFVATTGAVLLLVALHLVRQLGWSNR